MSKTVTTAAKPLFSLGLACATPGALEALSEAEQEAAEFLHRHQHGDWGDMCEEDRRENEFSVDKQLRIFSAYRLCPLTVPAVRRLINAVLNWTKCPQCQHVHQAQKVPLFSSA